MGSGSEGKVVRGMVFMWCSERMCRKKAKSTRKEEIGVKLATAEGKWVATRETRIDDVDASRLVY